MMLQAFLKERRSWILFFLSLQLLILFVAYLDTTIPLASLFYIVLLSTLLFIVFLFFRYRKETAYYMQLKAWDENIDHQIRLKPSSPFEQIVQEAASEQIDRYRQMTAKQKTALEEEKDELLSWIHEVKTPLTAMHLMIDRITEQPLKSNMTYEWLRIHLLLDAQLHQSRIQHIENDLFIEKLDLQNMLTKEIKALQSWCMQKGIGFDLLLEERDVLSDTKWLSFMIRQVLTNAVKYSQSSDIIIESKQMNEQVVLTITDQGRGIDPRDVSRIFEKGFTSTRHHNDTASTGMGLYLTKKGADALHITIEVNSTLDQGTTFTFIFPKKNDFVHIASM
ncbi:two-component sensor histidine kinase controlling resistance to antibiotics affecting the envelope (YtsA) [Bacillus altitudinis]|nr:two-component sensor histidine kinase controlling resistance to antibiotics affecting the envelope (YtsA) [Bacillus altitudinis]